MLHIIQLRVSELKNLDKTYYPTLSKAFFSNQHELFFSIVKENTDNIDQLLYSFNCLDFENITENLSENLYILQPIERYIE